MHNRLSLLPAILFCIFFAAPILAQNPPKQEEKPQGPPVKVNYLNVCAPSDVEQQEFTTALGRVPKSANFSQDFEITRGRSSMQDAAPARYIRLRRELSGDGLFSNVQYSLSTDAENIVETLVIKVKEPKELFSISLEDQVSSTAASPASLLDVNTPVSRIKLERFGKSNLVLARCPPADQSVYEPIFKKASELLAGYRKTLGLRGMFRTDLVWLAQVKSAGSSKAPDAMKAEKKAAKTAVKTSGNKGDPSPK